MPNQASRPLLDAFKRLVEQAKRVEENAGDSDCARLLASSVLDFAVDHVCIANQQPNGQLDEAIVPFNSPLRAKYLVWSQLK